MKNFDEKRKNYGRKAVLCILPKIVIIAASQFLGR